MSRWFDYVLKHLDKPWNWGGISRNPNIYWEDVVANSDLPWNYVYLMENPNITWDIIVKNFDRPWCIGRLSLRHDLDFNFVLENPTLNWHWEFISSNPNITWDIYKANKLWNHPNKTKRKIPWSSFGLSMNPNITMDIVEQNPRLGWSYSGLSQNPNLTLEFLEKHLDKFAPASYHVSKHKIVTIDFVLKHPEYPWGMSLYSNPNMTLDLILKHMNFLRKQPYISYSAEYAADNPNITIKEVRSVKQNSDKLFNYFNLSRNKNFTYKDILENTDIFPEHLIGCMCLNSTYDLTWNEYQLLKQEHKFMLVKEISVSPEINWDIVDQNPVLYTNEMMGCVIGWSYDHLSSNPMSEPSRKRIQERSRTIKQELIDYVFHPDFVTKKISKYGKDPVLENM